MKLLNKHKWLLIITSLVILLPIVFGLIMWNKLPEQMVTHWGIDGAADGLLSTALAVFLVPCLLLVVQWICVIVSFMDKNSAKQTDKALKIVLWIIPVLSLYINAIVYATALGIKADIYLGFSILFGILFAVIGNYLPKFSRNRTMGIKISWTLASDENWNATHRFAGKLWVVGGVLLMLTAFVPTVAKMYVMISVVACMVVIPIVYSYVFYRKQKENGDELVKTNVKEIKKHGAVSFVILLFIVAGIIVLMFTGNIKAELSEDALNVSATYSKDVTVKYSDIDNIEYREGGVDGARVMGFSSARLLLGQFQNDEYGLYARYTYTGKKPCIVITVDEKILVVGCNGGEETRALYDGLLEKCNISGDKE